MLKDIMLSAIMLSAVMLTEIVMRALMLCVFMLNTISPAKKAAESLFTNRNQNLNNGVARF
jgi:hypothetical protein